MKTLFALELHIIRQNPYMFDKIVNEFYETIVGSGNSKDWNDISPYMLISKYQIVGNSDFLITLPPAVEKELMSFLIPWGENSVSLWCDLMRGEGKIAELYSDILQWLATRHGIECFVYWGTNHTIRKFCKSAGLRSIAMELGPTRSPFLPTRYCDFAGVNGDAHVRNVDISAFEPMNLTAWRQSGGVCFANGSREDSIFNPLTTRYAERIYHRKKPCACLVLQLDDDSNCLIHSRYSGLLEMVQEVVPKLLDAGWLVLVKPHPGAGRNLVMNRDGARWMNVVAHEKCHEYINQLNSDSACWLDDVPPAEYPSLLSKMDAVITVNSSVGFEAMLMERPVVALGRAPYNIQDKLPTLDQLLENRIDYDAYTDFCRRTGNLMLNYYLGSANMASCPNELSRAIWRNLILEDAWDRGGSVELTAAIRRNPMNLIHHKV